MELIKDYDYVIDYHPGKTNVAADALSRKSVQTLRALNAHLSLSNDGAMVVELIAKPDLFYRVLEAQKNDEKIAAIVNQNRVGKEIEFTVKEDGFLYYRDRVCVLNVMNRRNPFLKRHTVDLLLCTLVAQRCIRI